MSQDRHRVAITGISAITALGNDIESTFRRLLAAERAFSEISEFDAANCRIRTAAEIKNFRVGDVAPVGKSSLLSRADALALAAARQALSRAKAERLQMFLAVGGTGGGMRESEPILMGSADVQSDAASTQRLLSYPIYSSTKTLASELPGVRHAATFCSACSSSATAITQAATWIAAGRSRCALAGGTDSLSLLTLTGFAALGAMSPEPCRPFDKARSGMSLGEGAAFLFLEDEAHARARGAEILAWLDGWSLGAEAHHLTHPEASGERSATLIRAALEHAGIGLEEVGYYNAHGTGTIPNDSMETNAVRRAFGEHWSSVRVSTAKGQLGHTLGAAGAIEAAITVSALREGMLPPTGGLATPADDAQLNHVIGRAVDAQCRYAISGSFGFGGLGAVLAFARVDTENRLPRLGAPGLVVTGSFGEATPEDPLAALDPERSRRFDRVTALSCIGAEHSNQGATGSGLVVSNACGNVERLRAYLQRLKAKGIKGIAPAEFPHLVPSAISGNTSIYSGLTGPATNIADECLGFENAIAFACDCIEQGMADSMVAGIAEAGDTGEKLISDPFGLGQGAGDTSAWLRIESATSARRSGKKTMATISSIDVGLGSWVQYFRATEAPLHVQRTALYFAGVDGRVLDDTPGLGNWARAVRAGGAMGLPARRSGPAAIAKALEAVANGSFDEALVVSGHRGEFFVMRLARA